MKVVVTGGTGFLGRSLAKHLLGRGELTGPSGSPERIDSIVLFDVLAPPDLDDELTGKVEL
ncbi:MAG: NAD-dependent epimerase/dehydratase family protein, partial [Acidimicrobiales bacterium]